MDTTNTTLMSILNNLQEKYTQMTVFYNATKTLFTLVGPQINEEALSAEINKRQQAMDAITRLDTQNRTLLSRLPAPLKDKIGECLTPSGKVLSLDNPLQTNIYETGKSILNLIKRTAEEDRKLNRKMNQLQMK